MRRLPKNESWKEELVEKATNPPPKPLISNSTDASIDNLMKRALDGIDKALKGTIAEISASGGVKTPSRECVMNLKDCLTMLSDLKKKEDDILEEMSDEELEKAVQDADSSRGR